jgi:hypothetical protein
VTLHARVLHVINVGVAISLGQVGALANRLSILGVSTSGNTSSARLFVRERNLGATFVSAKGEATCVSDRTRRVYPLLSDLVLPGDTARLAVSLRGFKPGASLDCHVVLRAVGAGRNAPTPAAWHGSVRFPSTPAPRVVQTGPHSYAEVPKSHVPRWAIALIAAGSAIVVALLITIAVLIRRRPPAATA